jgi:cysteinyl-tRNA synthetase
MNFTWEAQAASARALARLQEAFVSEAGAVGEGSRGGEAQEYRRRFREAIGDDLNAPRALAVAHEAARSGLSGEERRALAGEWDAVLGLGLLAEASGKEVPEEESPKEATPGEVADLAVRRDRCRRERRFAEADVLRERIRAAGYDVIDGKDGPSTIVRGGHH